MGSAEGLPGPPALSHREEARLARPRASIPGLANPEAAKAAEGPARARSVGTEHTGSIRPRRSAAPASRPGAPRSVLEDRLAPLYSAFFPQGMHTRGGSCVPQSAPVTWVATPHGGGPRAPASRPAEPLGRARRRGGRMRRGARRLCPAARVSMERRRPRLLRRTLRQWRWRPSPMKWTSSPPHTGG